MHVLRGISSDFRVLPDGSVNLVNEKGRDEEDDEHDGIQEDGPIPIDLNSAEVFASKLLRHESTDSEGEANTEREGSDANSERA